MHGELKPRKYQSDLADYCFQKNAIVYLPTGSGKTFIAILTIKRFSPTVQSSLKDGGKRILFMCNTVELARQQALELRKSLNLKIGYYTGDRSVENWSIHKWSEEIIENQVLVGTAQVFLDVICKNYMKLSDISLVVIDECHHATKQHPMKEFLNTFANQSNSPLPRVIGLSGVLLTGNKVGNVMSDLHSLESTFNGKIITTKNDEEQRNVLLYSTKPKEEVVSFSISEHRFALIDEIKKTIEELCAKIECWGIGHVPLKLSKGLNAIREPNKKSYIINLLKDFIYQMETYGLYSASIAILSPIIEFEIKKRSAESVAMRKLYRYCITVCEYILHKIKKKLLEFNDDDDPTCTYNSEECIVNYSTEKLRTFLSCITKKFIDKKKEDICCLVFVERRYTAKCLYYVLKRFIELKPDLSSIVYPDFMVGRNTINQDIEETLQRKWNQSVIQQFREKKCNLIICSSVLEEGIDVQACNYVFVLDPLKTFNSYIQTKGRARAVDATYLIFTNSTDQLKIVHKIKNYKIAHESILGYLQGRVLDDNDFEDGFESQKSKDFIQNFVTKEGAQIAASNSLRILASYCQSLPSDAFGWVQPRYTLDSRDESGCIISLNLPIQCSIKETIKSDKMKNVKLAKISAAFKACIKLYKAGELTERLDPIAKKDVLANTADSLFTHWEKFNDKVTALNEHNKKKLTVLDRLYPVELFNSAPCAGERCYVYEIKFLPDFKKNDYNYHIFDIFESKQNISILLRKKLPRLASMPLFMNQGQVNVQISEHPIEIEFLTEDQISMIRQHQIVISRNILECWNPFYVVDNRNKENSYLIVPTVDQQINWRVIEKFQSFPHMRQYSVAERSKKTHKLEDYIGNIVTKWYDGSQTAFVVTNVLTTLTPLSPFEDTAYINYAQYMEQKYSQTIEKVVNLNQFLIEVKEITKRRNFFANALGKNKDINKTARKIILIPELCHNYEYPADLWMKILILPSIFHRLTTMLHAEELRVRLNKFLGFGDMPNYKPQPLKVDVSLKRAVDCDGNMIGEIEVSHKKLSLLPPKEKINFTKQLKLTDELGWKTYQEPCDYSRHCSNIYPVELDYVYKFQSGLLTNIQFKEELWSESQMEMQVNLRSALTANNLVKNSNSIEDVPIDQKRRLEILEISLGAVVMKPLEQCDLTAALTTSSASDVYDMERFEILGDSFLKLSASIYLVNRYPEWHEGLLSELKSVIVSNRNLLYCLLETDIPQRIQSSQLRNPKYDWLPPIVSLPTNLLDMLREKNNKITNLSSEDLYELDLSEEEITTGICSNDNLKRVERSCNARVSGVEDECNNINHLIHKTTLQNKIVADTLEALLGVIVKCYGIHNGFKLLEYFKVLKNDKTTTISNFLDIQLSNKQCRTDLPAKEVDSFIVNYQILEKNLNYKFKDRAYLLQALTHPSFPTNRLTGCYQELEFIGDAILDFLITAYIFERFERMTPGKLTDFRSALVNNVTLACICVRHRFHLFLLSENCALNESIKTFEAFQQSQDYLVTEQVRFLSEETVVNYRHNNNFKSSKFNISAGVDVPKALGDIVESLIAAVYLDSRDLRVTWNVIYHLFAQELELFSQNVPKDPVRELYEHKYACPQFSEPFQEEDVVLITCEFTSLNKKVSVNGFGKNSKQAKKSAATMALNILSKYTN